jgi:2-methylcitrate dehydratase PrpD
MSTDMRRRDFLRNAAGGVALGALGASRPTLATADVPQACAEAAFPQIQKVTAHVSEFVVHLKFPDIPAESLELGKKSILDGLGLALSGSKAETWALIQEYMKPFGFSPSEGAAVLGSGVRLPARFAAFANGVAIHVDDFDDTQLAVAKDRVYGLLVHPTVCVLPAALATAEIAGRSGRDLLVAYEAGVEVECKIAEAISPRHYEDGFHSWTGQSEHRGGDGDPGEHLHPLRLRSHHHIRF